MGLFLSSSFSLTHTDTIRHRDVWVCSLQRPHTHRFMHTPLHRLHYAYSCVLWLADTHDLLCPHPTVPPLFSRMLWFPSYVTLQNCTVVKRCLCCYCETDLWGSVVFLMCWIIYTFFFCVCIVSPSQPNKVIQNCWVFFLLSWGIFQEVQDWSYSFTLLCECNLCW